MSTRHFLTQVMRGLLLAALLSSRGVAIAASCFAMPAEAPCEDLGAARPSIQDLHDRLEAVSHAVNDFAMLPTDGAHILSVSNRNKTQTGWTESAIWCEKLLQDVIELKNIEIVTDVGDQGPIWLKEKDYIKKSDSADESFFVSYVEGRKVVSGYVNVLWNRETLLTLRVSGACVGSGDDHRRCTGAVHASVWVYGPDKAHGCDAHAPDRLAWPYWMHKDTLIHLTPRGYKTVSSGSPVWLKAGSATEGDDTHSVYFDYANISLQGENLKVQLRLNHTKPRRVEGTDKEYREELIAVNANCSAGKFDALSRELKLSDGTSIGAGVSQNVFQEQSGASKGAFLKSLCFLHQNRFELPAINPRAQWDTMTSPVAATKLGEAKARRQYKNGLLLVAQRNDVDKAVDMDGVLSKTLVLLSAFNCRKQTMNRVIGFSYGLDDKPSGVFFFDEKDSAPQLPENRQRFVNACAEMEAKD